MVKDVWPGQELVLYLNDRKPPKILPVVVVEAHRVGPPDMVVVRVPAWTPSEYYNVHRTRLHASEEDLAAELLLLAAGHKPEEA